MKRDFLSIKWLSKEFIHSMRVRPFDTQLTNGSSFSERGVWKNQVSVWISWRDHSLAFFATSGRFISSFLQSAKPPCEYKSWKHFRFYYPLFHLIRFLISLQIVLLRCFENITDDGNSWRLYEILEPWYRIFAAQRTILRIFFREKKNQIS